jgi:enoyl-CoA hydratase/carnithine racemase
MEMIKTEFDGNIVLLRLNRGVTNAWNLELVDALRESLHKAQDDSNVRGVVLTGSNHKFFSIGFDIPELFPLDRTDFQKFFYAYNQLCIDLFAFPKPTVAVITGHAVAGGCIIALCCDYRFIAEGHKLMGLNEIKLGVSIPYPGDCILREVVGIRTARDICDSGDFFEAEKLHQIGMVDRVLPLEQVLPEAIKYVKRIGGFSQKAFAQIKQDRTEMVMAQIQKHLVKKEQQFLDCWFSEETRARLKDAMQKF